MLSLATVLAIIMVVINVTNFAEMRQDADALLSALESGGGAFVFEDAREMPQNNDGAQQNNVELPPAAPPDGNVLPRDGRKPDSIEDKSRRFNAETPYATRYFTVSVDANGTLNANTSSIAAIGEDRAKEMARQVLDSGKKKGYVGVYRYLVTGNDTMVLFVDCNRQLQTAKTFLNISLIASAAALLGMFILVFIFSKRAVKPTVEAYERQRQFVTEASHELKTPITIISANNELLALEYGENESTDAIDHQVKRLAAMVKNMVSLSRLDEAEHIEQSTCNLSDCVTEHIDLYRNALIAGERRLETDIDEGVTVSGNIDLLAQLTGILLDNAIKYAATYTHVSLKQDKGITLTVKNDAANLTDGDKSRCFERFYRDVDVTQHIEGSGIGLAIAKQIVGLHKGTITANAKNGAFIVTVNL
jgi:hypothetical protein